MNKSIFKVYIKNIILPCLIFSLITGILTAGVVVLYKYLANLVINYSDQVYSFLKGNLVYLPLAIVVLLVIAIGLHYLFRFAPDSKGGGIATAIAFVRGLVTFKWLRTLIGVLFSSLITFFIGTPLGNEGPCVLAGATVGRGVISIAGKKSKAWDKYIMTGGACAGFATATNAPISGILFAIEDAHHRLSPMILMVAGATVTFALITSHYLCLLLGVSSELFSSLAPITLQVSELWLPLIIGITSGFFSVGFIKCLKLLRKVLSKFVKPSKKTFFILLIFIFTVILGCISENFIGTGHHLIESILQPASITIISLILALVVRFILTGAGNCSGITGGMFIPTLAFGALLSAVIAKILISTSILGEEYYQVIVLLGMTACFSGLTKTPLTAIVFAFEALSLSSNLLSVAIVAISAYIVSEIFCPKSANDEIMEMRVEEEQEGKTSQLIDATVEVKENSFVVGKQIRDVLWPNNLFVLSLKRSDKRPEIDEHGEKNMYPGDVLHVRYSTYNPAQTREELIALVGEQNYTEEECEYR